LDAFFFYISSACRVCIALWEALFILCISVFFAGYDYSIIDETVLLTSSPIYPSIQFVDTCRLTSSTVLDLAPSLFENLKLSASQDLSLRSRWLSGYFSEPTVRDTFTWLYTHSENQSSLSRLLPFRDHLFPENLIGLYNLEPYLSQTLNDFSIEALDTLTPFYDHLLSSSDYASCLPQSLFSPCTILCRLILYPPFSSSKYSDLGYRANEHIDPSLFTLLAAQSSPGLQYHRDCIWIDYVHSFEQSLLMLGQWASWLSPRASRPLKHRVVFNRSPEARYSLQVFFLGNLNFILDSDKSSAILPFSLKSSFHKITQSFRSKFLDYDPQARWDTWLPYRSS